MPKPLLRPWKRALPLLILLALSTGSARAGLQAYITEDASSPFATNATTVVLNIPTISATGLTLSYTGTIGHYTITGLTIDSNSTTTDIIGQIKSGGTVFQTDTAAGHTLTVVASDNSYLLPVGSAYKLDSSTSDTFTNAGVADFQTYNGYSEANNTNVTPALFGHTFSNNTLTLTNTSSDPVFGPFDGGTYSYSANASPTNFTSNFVPYALTNVVTISLGAADDSGSGLERSLQFQGTTTALARPVPEPSSLALLGSGALGALGVALRRRAARV